MVRNDHENNLSVKHEEIRAEWVGRWRGNAQVLPYPPPLRNSFVSSPSRETRPVRVANLARKTSLEERRREPKIASSYYGVSGGVEITPKHGHEVMHLGNGTLNGISGKELS